MVNGAQARHTVPVIHGRQSSTTANREGRYRLTPKRTKTNQRPQSAEFYASAAMPGVRTLNTLYYNRPRGGEGSR